MLEALVLIIAVIAMAKGKPRRKMGRYIRGTVDDEVNLGTLAGSTLVSALFGNVVNERTLVSSLVAAWSLVTVTPVAGVGPVMCGVAHSDYTDAEIEAVIEATGSWNEGDLVAQEIGRRKVRRIGIFDTPQAVEDAVSLNDGKAIKTKLNWILLQGQSLRLWAYNMGGSAFATTTPVVRAQGHANLFPK